MNVVFVKTLKRTRPVAGTTTTSGSYKPAGKTTDPNWRGGKDYSGGVKGGAKTLFGAQTRETSGRFGGTGTKTASEVISQLSPADYEAGKAFARGSQIDEATLDRLGKAGLLQQDKKSGRVMMTPESRLAMVMSQPSHALIMKERAEKKKADAEAVANQKKLDAENKKKAAESKRAADKEAAEKKRAQAVVDKENAKIQAIKDKQEAQRRDDELKKQTLETTAVEAGLSLAELNGLMSFVKGKDIPFGSALGDKLLGFGFLSKMPDEDSYTLGGTASPFMNAAMSGNLRGAKDIIKIAKAQKRAADAKVPIAAPVAGITTPVQGEAGRIIVPEKKYTPVLKFKPAVKELSRRIQILFLRT